MQKATRTFAKKRADGVAQVPMEEWRNKASEVRSRVIDNLSGLVQLFSEKATNAGATVHGPVDAERARRVVADILAQRSVRMAVKAKSMVTEEIRLNEFLEDRGVEVVETDLGEYIVQIAGEKPSHILAPAIHKDRRQVGRLFSEKLGASYSEDPAVLTKIARRALREKFLRADAGISGANFAGADSGSLVIFTNEGNGRMVTHLPPLHIAVITVEKMIPSLADLPSFIRLLPRSATGQSLSSYVQIITGTRRVGEAAGARELHIVLVDNGRFSVLEGPYRDILKCIRCSACMNVCPVYATVGGHSYDSTYPGPMGIVLTAVLEGLERAHPLLNASTLCGACDAVCPVKVPLSSLIRRLREAAVDAGLTPAIERLGMAAFSRAAASPLWFDLGQIVAGLTWPLARLLGRRIHAERFPAPTIGLRKRSGI
jgi:L-lactate dehydrogenase complex protein LldF